MPTTLDQPTATAPATKKRVSFAKAPKKEESKTSYPVFNDPAAGNEVFAIAARIKARQSDMEALEGAQELDKAELRARVTPFYFQSNANRPTAPSSVSVPSENGEVLVTFSSKYKKFGDNTEAQLIGAIGQEAYDELFRQTFSLTIAGDKLPAGKEQEIVDAVQAALESHAALDALDVKDSVAPIKDYHSLRLLRFTPEQNLALEEICPCVTMVKTKGRGK